MKKLGEIRKVWYVEIGREYILGCSDLFADYEYNGSIYDGD